MFKGLLLSTNKAGVPLPPGAEIFNVAVETDGVYTSFWIDAPNSSIQPNTFMGIQINGLYCGLDSMALAGTTLVLQNYQTPTQNITVIRLDSGLAVKLEKSELLQMHYYYSDLQIISHEDIGKTIKVALLAN